MSKELTANLLDWLNNQMLVKLTIDCSLQCDSEEKEILKQYAQIAEEYLNKAKIKLLEDVKDESD